MAIIDVVKFDFATNVFAWKYPSCELSTWTQLIVNESQEAMLFKEGKMVGPFGPGRHVLSTENYPILGSLLKIPFGRSPFTAEVWFVQKAHNLDIKWGTPVPMQLEDPQYHIMIPVKAFGQYGISIADSAKFLVKLNGTLPAFTSKTLVPFFRGIVLTQTQNFIAKYLLEKEISILHIAAHLVELSEVLQSKINEYLSSYGVEMVNFSISSINTDNDDPAVKKLRETLATKLEMDVLNFNYQQKRSFDTMQAAAENTAGNSMINTGVGLGVGVGIGGGMGVAAQQLTANLQPQNDKGVPCSKCGTLNRENAQFCSNCGNKIQVAAQQSATVKCDKCGFEAPKGSKFCPNCGDVFFLCPQCGCDNPEGAAFCINCQAPLPVTCPNCGKQNEPNAMFCGNCGKPLGATCPKCGKKIQPNQKFCFECGTKLGE